MSTTGSSRSCSSSVAQRAAPPRNWSFRPSAPGLRRRGREYQCAVIKTKETTVMSALNSAGAKGWELASLVPAHADHEFISDDYGVDAYTLCAKRALP